MPTIYTAHLVLLQRKTNLFFQSVYYKFVAISIISWPISRQYVQILWKDFNDVVRNRFFFYSKCKISSWLIYEGDSSWRNDYCYCSRKRHFLTNLIVVEISGFWIIDIRESFVLSMVICKLGNNTLNSTSVIHLRIWFPVVGPLISHIIMLNNVILWIATLHGFTL